MIEPSYYAIIPSNVRYDKRLKANEKLLYGEITALANSTGYCYATNKYFAELYDVTNTSISLWVKNLVDCGYIKSHIQYREGTKEILKRYLSLVIHPIQEILNTPMQEILKDNNTSNNTTSINDNVPTNEFAGTLFQGDPVLQAPVKKQKNEKVTIFKNSPAADKEAFNKKFKNEIEAGINMDHYYDSVHDWSETKLGVKRTANGWYATVRNFMRRDNEKPGGVKMVSNGPKKPVFTDAMKKYLTS